MHFFSPTHIMKLVECVRGAKTSPQVLATIAAVSQKMDKVLVMGGDGDGGGAHQFWCMEMQPCLSLLVDSS